MADDTHVTAIRLPRQDGYPLTRVDNLARALGARPDRIFALEQSSGRASARFMVRSRSDASIDRTVRGHYRDGHVEAIGPEADPMQLADGERMWTQRLRVSGPDWLPLTVLDERGISQRDGGGDPLTGVIDGMQSAADDCERVIIRYILQKASLKRAQTAQRDAAVELLNERRQPVRTESTGSGSGTPTWMIALMPSVMVAAVGIYLRSIGAQAWQGIIFLAGVLAVLTLLTIGVIAWRRRDTPTKEGLLSRSLMDQRLNYPLFECEIQIHLVLKGPDATREAAKDVLSSIVELLEPFSNSIGSRLVGDELVEGPLKDLLALPSKRRLGWKAQPRPLIGSLEIASLWHTPAKAEVNRMTYRPMPMLGGDDPEGALIGTLTAGTSQPAFLPKDTLSRHLFLIAKSTMGKSTLVGHLVRHVMVENSTARKPRALVVVDPHADLVDELIAHVPQPLHNRVKLVDLRNQMNVIGINPLDTRVFDDRDYACDSVVRAIRNQAGDHWGNRMQRIFTNLLRALYEANERLDREDQYTLVDAPDMLTDKEFREQVLSLVDDPFVRRFWDETFTSWTSAQIAEYIGPVQLRLDPYSTSRMARRILGQPSCSIDFPQAIQDGDVILISTSLGAAGSEVSELIGACLLNLVESVVRRQGLLPRSERRAVTVVVDEMQRIPGADYNGMMSELQKFGGNIILITQSVDNINSVASLSGTVLPNVGGLFVFQCSARDAAVLLPELASNQIDVIDIISLPAYHCYIHARSGTEPMATYSVMINPPLGRREENERAVRDGVPNYSRPVEEVDRILQSRATLRTPATGSPSRGNGTIGRGRRGRQTYPRNDGRTRPSPGPGRQSTEDDIRSRTVDLNWPGDRMDGN